MNQRDGKAFHILGGISRHHILGLGKIGHSILPVKEALRSMKLRIAKPPKKSNSTSLTHIC